MRILIVDNYDSFTYNIYNYVCVNCKKHGVPFENVQVIKNDEKNINEIIKIDPTHIIFGPGQGTVYRKRDIGISEEILRFFQTRCRVLGICLGHQLIYKFYGGKVVVANEIVHGKGDFAHIDREDDIFHNVGEDIIKIMRYHSQIGDAATLPDRLKVIAMTGDIIMGVKHMEYNVWGLQFHPESIGTPKGLKIIENFLFYDKLVEIDTGDVFV